MHTLHPSQPPPTANRRGHWRGANAAADIIEAHYDGARRGVALAHYSALTILASRQRTPEKVVAAVATIAATAGYQEAAARRYLHQFAALGLIRIETRPHRPNTYHLLKPLEADGGDVQDEKRKDERGKGVCNAPLQITPEAVGARSITPSPQPLPLGVNNFPLITAQPRDVGARSSTPLPQPIPMREGSRGGSPAIPLPVAAQAQVVVEGDHQRSPTEEVKTKEKDNNKADAVVAGVDDDLTRRLRLIGIKQRVAGRLITAHGSDRVRSVLAEAWRHGQRPAAWLIAALRDGYDVRPVQRGGDNWVAVEAERLRLAQADEGVSENSQNLKDEQPTCPKTEMSSPLFEGEVGRGSRSNPVISPPYKPPTEAAHALWHWTAEDAGRQLPHLKGWLTNATLVGTEGLTMYVHTPARHLLSGYTEMVKRLATEKLGKPVVVVWV